MLQPTNWQNLRKEYVWYKRRIIISVFAPKQDEVAPNNIFPKATVEDCLEMFGETKVNTGYSFK